MKFQISLSRARFAVNGQSLIQWYDKNVITHDLELQLAELKLFSELILSVFVFSTSFSTPFSQDCASPPACTDCFSSSMDTRSIVR